MSFRSLVLNHIHRSLQLKWKLICQRFVEKCKWNLKGNHPQFDADKGAIAHINDELPIVKKLWERIPISLQGRIYIILFILLDLHRRVDWFRQYSKHEITFNQRNPASTRPWKSNICFPHKMRLLHIKASFNKTWSSRELV